MMTDKKIVLFDGVCNFCNYWIRFIFKLNKKKNLFFMSLQDERSASLISKQYNPGDMTSVIYYNQGKVFTHSTAVLKICGELNFFFKILSNLQLLIPKKIRDGIYSYIAKRRYNWFGRKEDCPLPSPELKKQFL